MKTVYTVQFYEEGLRSDGFYEFETIGQLYQYLRLFSGSKYKVTVCVRKHEIERPCDVCSAGSIKETIRLVIEK